MNKLEMTEVHPLNRLRTSQMAAERECRLPVDIRPSYSRAQKVLSGLNSALLNELDPSRASTVSIHTGSCGK